MSTRRAARLATRAVGRRIRSGDGRGIITFRHITRLAGPEPDANPPRIASLIVDGDFVAGASAIGLRGNALIGRFIPGDILTAGEAILTVAATAIASGNAATVQITAPLAGPLSDGAAVTPRWLNEVAVAASITGLGSTIPDGRMVQSTDLFVEVAAGALPWPPAIGDQVVLPTGGPRDIVSATPILVDGVPISYRLQVR